MSRNLHAADTDNRESPQRMQGRTGSIVIVDDDPEYPLMVEQALRPRGHTVCSLKAGSRVIEDIVAARPRLAILDIELPGVSGLDLCRQLKQHPKGRTIATMIVTGHVVRPYWLGSIRLGADLFLPKTTPLDELIECVEALLHRVPTDPAHDGVIRIGRLAIDPAQGILEFDGKRVEDLTCKLFDLAHLLAQEPNRVFDRHEIMRRLRMPTVRDNEVNVLMHLLRRKIGHRSEQVFRTKRGRGYFLDEGSC